MTDEPTARGDTFALLAGHGQTAMFRRLLHALEASRAVHMGAACWTREGARYLRVPFAR